MRDFFTSRFFVLTSIIIAVCLAFAVYTGIFSTSISPATAAVGAVLTPIESSIVWVTDKIEHVYNYFFEYDHVFEENTQLRRQLSDANQKLRDAQNALDENDKLRDLLEIKKRSRDFQFEIAEVISKSTNNWSSTISIDKGSLSGISVDDCVITEEGMVGYVSDLGPNFCEITTVIDTAMQVGIIVSRSREVAVCEGDFGFMQNNMLKLSYIKKNADIVIGDTIETSGNGGVYPKGIVIGTVERILPEDHGMSNYAIISPAVNLDKISKVFVIKDFDIVD